MQYDQIKAVKLRNGGGVMLFNSVTAVRKREIIDAGDYEYTIKAGELLKGDLPIQEATEASHTMLEQYAINKTLALAKSNPQAALQALDKQMIEAIDKLVSGGMDKLKAHQQVAASELGKKIATVKQQVRQMEREKGSIANQGQTDLKKAQQTVKTMRSDIYAQHTQAVQNGDHVTAAKLAKVLKDA